QALEAQQSMQAGRSELALGLMGQAGQEMQTPEGFWNNLPEVASTPSAPDFYGQNLPTMGQWPNPQGQPPPAGAPEYGNLAPWGQTPQGGGQVQIPENGGIAGGMGPQGQDRKRAEPPSQGPHTMEYAGPSQGGMMGGMPPRGDVAQGDMSGIGPAGQGPQTGMGDLSQYGGANINTIMGNLGNVGRGVSSQMGDLGQIGQGLTMGSYSPEDIQRSLDYSGLENVQSGGTYQDRFAQAQFERDMSLQGPLMQRAQAEQESA
ncbi:unnamed protein product, partial [marine sediment metagenome]